MGFRPFVAKCADICGMKGEVLNTGGLVNIVVTDTEQRIEAFLKYLIVNKPKPAEIVHIKREIITTREFEGFTILKSDEGTDDAAMIPADLAICPDCLREMYEKDNPRYMHPFISCMVCGPRFTIIDKFPYDRDNTAMVDWPMCDFCNDQYTDRSNRRYHAQTISCHDCGPVLIYKERVGRFEPFGEKIQRQVLDPIRRAGNVIMKGGVIAMKGVGGYNLIADPLNPKAVASLREIKNREQKPFAVMFKNIETIRTFCKVDEVEEELLNSSAKPIVLLERCPVSEFEDRLSESDPEAVKREWFPDERKEMASLREFKKSRFIGAFLPSMGAQHLLLDRFGVLIVTSANISDMPIILKDQEMFAFMEANPLLEGCLYNKRDIRRSVDDSVVRVVDEQPQVIRRSKGYAPVPIHVSAEPDSVAREPEKDDMVLALGGQLKNAFAVSKGHFVYLSQYFGDMDSRGTVKMYQETLDDMMAMFRISPKLLVCDMHPIYGTTLYAKKLSTKRGGIPVLQVQHHHAHICSVIAEHEISGYVIGVAMDGTGYGTDGAIWGGEFLVCRGAGFKREGHIKYIHMLGGDASVKDASKSAVCWQWAWQHGYFDEMAQSGILPVGEKEKGEGKPDEVVPDLTDIMAYAEKNGFEVEDRNTIEKALEMGINRMPSSSMGRLFDAVSALLGIKKYNDYEGQCASMLEDAAAEAQKAIAEGREPDEAGKLALDFHLQIASLIYDECCRIRLRYAVKGKLLSKVALSGGSFQNKLLMEETLRLLREGGFEVYYNVAVSPNDGGLALGQNYIGTHYLLRTANSDCSPSFLMKEGKGQGPAPGR